jgi:hypothetical protein
VVGLDFSTWQGRAHGMQSARHTLLLLLLFFFFWCCCYVWVFFLFFLSPVGYKTGCSFPAIVESCDGPPVASIASVRSPAQVNESRRNSQKFLQKEREKKRWVGENIRDMATTRPLILSLSLSLPRHRTPLCKSENSPSHTAQHTHTQHKRVKHPERSRLDGQVGGWFDAPGHQTVPQHDRGFIIHFSRPLLLLLLISLLAATVWYFRISLLPNEAKEARGYILPTTHHENSVNGSSTRACVHKNKKNKDTRWCKVRFILARLGCVLSAYRHRRLRRRWFVRPSVRLFPWGAVF